MPYIGNQGSVAGFVNQPSKQDLTGATGGTLTLTHAVSGPEDISLFINHVRQEPTTSYTASGTTVTLQGYTVSASDDIYVLYNGLTQLSSVPVDGSVSTAKIANSAVDLTSKVTGILPVANGGTGSSSSSVYISRFGLTSNLTANGTLTAWSAPTISNQVATIGSAVTVSSGLFTFPVTGVWRVHLNARVITTSDGTLAAALELTTDNGSNYTEIAVASEGDGASTTNTGSIVLTDYINCDNVSNVKVRFKGNSIASGGYIQGQAVASGLRTWVSFERITDAQ